MQPGPEDDAAQQDGRRQLLPAGPPDPCIELCAQSVGAAYGVVAFFAAGGWAGELIGIETATPVAPWIPVIMFAILFGLSMDYEVFSSRASARST